MKRYAIVITKIPGSNYSAFAPDVDGCVAAGESIEEVTRLMQEGLQFHFEGLREDGVPIPEPAAEVRFVDVEVPAGTEAVRTR